MYCTYVLIHTSLLVSQQSSHFLFGLVAVILFQEVWGRSFCRTIEKLVEVVQEYPGEVEHIYSPACVPLVRCAGCCGDENLECHPTITSNITMQVCSNEVSDTGTICSHFRSITCKYRHSAAGRPSITTLPYVNIDSKTIFRQTVIVADL